MPNVTVYIRNEDYEKWKALPHKAKYVSMMINDLPYIKPVEKELKYNTFDGFDEADKAQEELDK